MRALKVLIISVTLALMAAVLATVQAGTAYATPVLGALSGAGVRPGATRLSFYAGDSVTAAVDVGSGNLLVNVRSLALPDVNGQLQLGASYNSAVGVTDTTLPRLSGRGWSLDYTDDIRMVPETSTPASSAVTYRAPGGLVGVFTPVAGSSAPIRYTSPAGHHCIRWRRHLQLVSARQAPPGAEGQAHQDRRRLPDQGPDDDGWRLHIHTDRHRCQWYHRHQALQDPGQLISTLGSIAPTGDK